MRPARIVIHVFRLAWEHLLVPPVAAFWHGRDERVRDGAGRLQWVTYRCSRDLDYDVFARVQVHASGQDRWSGPHPLVALGLAFGFPAFLIAAIIAFEAGVMTFSLVFVSAVVFALALSVWRRTRRIPAKCTVETVRDAWLAEGLCPSCAYQVVPGKHSGAAPVHCPECGAAWRSPSESGVSRFAREKRESARATRRPDGNARAAID
jgi:hypothetical protein